MSSTASGAHSEILKFSAGPSLPLKTLLSLDLFLVDEYMDGVPVERFQPGWVPPECVPLEYVALECVALENVAKVLVVVYVLSVATEADVSTVETESTEGVLGTKAWRGSILCGGMELPGAIPTM